MQIRILYPSGNCFQMVGNFVGLTDPTRAIQTICIEISGDQVILDEMVSDKALYLCDPRGLYFNTDTHFLIYNPAEHRVELASEWNQWLTENPHWPPAEISFPALKRPDKSFTSQLRYQGVKRK